MHAMLLCAGLGTRLRPLTEELPKPLVPLLGRPLAAYALERLSLAGVRHVVANTFHLGHLVRDALSPHARKAQLAWETHQEPELLGTGGGIRAMLPFVGDAPFVVFNGDVLAAPDLRAALATHARLGAAMTLILRRFPETGKNPGAIELDADGRVRRILDEGPAPDVPVRRCMFTGIYVISPSAVRDDLPENGCIVRHTLRRLLARGATVGGVFDDGPWFDLGTLQTYADVTFGLLDGSVRYPGIEPAFEARWVDRLAVLGPDVRVGRHVAVGARARIGGKGVLSRAIVWDGATVDAPLADTFVSTRGLRVPIVAA